MHGILTAKSDLLVYECDGFTIEKNQPEVVVFPTTTEQIVQIVKACNELGLPFLAQGAGTSLAGGCVPVGGGVMIAPGPHEADSRSELSRSLCRRGAGRRQYMADEPTASRTTLSLCTDPSSQGACTIGGNVATNSGGPHTLKYGVTVNHVIGVELVLPDGEVITTGGPGRRYARLRSDRRDRRVGRDFRHRQQSVGADDPPTRNRIALCSASSKRSTMQPTRSATSLVQASCRDAGNARSIDLGRVEQAFKFGFPLDAGAVLIMEVDGLNAGLDEEAPKIEAIAKKNRAREVPPGQYRSRTAAVMEMPQAGVWRGRPAWPKLLHSRRRGAADQVAAHAAVHHEHRSEISDPDRQCFPRGRRQPPSDSAFR